MIENLSFNFDISPDVNVIDSTKYKSYISCERMFFYEYVLGWQPQGSSIHLDFGTAMHKAYEVFWTEGYGEIKNAYQAFMDSFTKKFPDSDEWELYHPKTPSRALMALIAYSYYYESIDSQYTVAHWDNQPLIEIGGKITLTESTDLAFKMDVVLEDSSGHIRARDLKTGAPFRNWQNQFDLAPQSGSYSHVLFCTNPPEVVEGVEYDGLLFKKTVPAKTPTHPEDCLRHFEFVRHLVHYSREQMNLWYHKMVTRLNMMREDFEILSNESERSPFMTSFPMREKDCHSFYGRECMWKDFCANWMNPLKHVSEPPIGFEVRHWNPLTEDIRVRLTI